MRSTLPFHLRGRLRPRKVKGLFQGRPISSGPNSHFECAARHFSLLGRIYSRSAVHLLTDESTALRYSRVWMSRSRATLTLFSDIMIRISIIPRKEPEKGKRIFFCRTFPGTQNTMIKKKVIWGRCFLFVSGTLAEWNPALTLSLRVCVLFLREGLPESSDTKDCIPSHWLIKSENNILKQTRSQNRHLYRERTPLLGKQLSSEVSVKKFVK